MAFVNDYRRTGAALLAVGSTAVLVWFGTGLHPQWSLLWFAPLPVLLFASHNSWWGTALTAALSWLIGSLNMWYYFSVALHMPPLIWTAIFVFPALVFAAAVLLFRALLRRGSSLGQGPHRRSGNHRRLSIAARSPLAVGNGE